MCCNTCRDIHGWPGGGKRRNEEVEEGGGRDQPTFTSGVLERSVTVPRLIDMIGMSIGEKDFGACSDVPRCPQFTYMGWTIGDGDTGILVPWACIS